jgi:hypothetical protein
MVIIDNSLRLCIDNNILCDRERFPGDLISQGKTTALLTAAEEPTKDNIYHSA